MKDDEKLPEFKVVRPSETVGHDEYPYYSIVAPDGKTSVRLQANDELEIEITTTNADGLEIKIPLPVVDFNDLMKGGLGLVDNYKWGLYDVISDSEDIDEIRWSNNELLLMSTLLDDVPHRSDDFDDDDDDFDDDDFDDEDEEYDEEDDLIDDADDNDDDLKEEVKPEK